ncbi:MAG: FecR domain-containing protein [Deltaproteobacteria bacterium]|nr:FecR domain-containing protein [Deltaproteobacteria bacterium]
MTTQKKVTCEDVMRMSEVVFANSTISRAESPDRLSSRLGVLSSTELAMYRRHIQDCAVCRVSDSVKFLMRKEVPFREDELQNRRLLGAAIAKARGSQANDVNSSGSPDGIGLTGRKNRRWLVIGTAAALLLAFVAFLAGRGLNSGSVESGALVRHVALNDAAARKDKDRATMPDRSRHSPAIQSTKTDATEANRVALASGVDALLDAGSQLKIVQNDDMLLRVRLISGRMLASVNPEVPHPLVEVETFKGTVTVKGTIFSVAVSSEVNVTVLRGVVKVAGAQKSIMVPAGNGLKIGNATAHQLSEVEQNTLAHTLAQLEEKCHEEGKTRETAVQRTAPFPRDGKRDLLLAQSAEIEKRRVSRLMAEARNYKNQRNWVGALDTYEAVIALSPRSSFAASARIAAGNIRLRFGDASGALKHYNEYLAGSNLVLRQEALLGKIQSLGKLKNTQGELAAVNEFIAAYPESIHVNQLMQRKQELQ